MSNEVYESPWVEMMSVVVEKGFANSGDIDDLQVSPEVWK